MDDRINFKIEAIPDIDILYLAAHKNFLQSDMGDHIPVGVFRSQISERSPEKGHMSTDWNKYSTAIDTKQRRSKPEDNAVLSMPVNEVRRIPLNVTHDPLLDNHSHSIIYNVDGHKKRIHTQMIRRKLSRIAKWEIHI